MAFSEVIGAVIITSLVAIMKVFCVTLVGIYTALYPKGQPYLPITTLKSLSRLSNGILLPCLIISSLGSSLTPKSFSVLSILILFAVINVTLSYIVASSLGRYLDIDKDDRVLDGLIVAISSPNAISLPIMIMATLCEQSVVNADFDNSILQCNAEATSMLFVYSIGWHLLYWSVGFPMLESVKQSYSEVPVANKHNTTFHAIHTWLHRVALSGVMVSIYCGVLVGLIPMLKAAMFEKLSILRPIGSAMVTLGQAVVPINTVIMAASLTTVPKEELLERFDMVVSPCFALYSRVQWITQKLRRSVSRRLQIGSSEHEDKHETADTVVTRERAETTSTNGFDYYDCVEEHQELEVNDSSITLAETSSPLQQLPQGVQPKCPESTITRENIDVHNTTLMLDKCSHVRYHSDRLIIIHTLCRLIIPPALMVIFLYVVYGAHIDNALQRLMLLIVIIESASPSAQVVLVCLQQLDLPYVATKLSYLYIYHYSLSIISIAAFTSIAMSMLYY